MPLSSRHLFFPTFLRSFFFLPLFVSIFLSPCLSFFLPFSFLPLHFYLTRAPFLFLSPSLFLSSFLPSYRLSLLYSSACKAPCFGSIISGVAQEVGLKMRFNNVSKIALPRMRTRSRFSAGPGMSCARSQSL